MSRDDLHRLVDTLPELAIPHADQMLKHLQDWPPKPPTSPQLEKIRRQQQERLEQRQGKGAGGVSGGFYLTREGGRVQNARSSVPYHEDGASVLETHLFHQGNEVIITERVRLADNGKTLNFKTEVTGPDGKRFDQDLVFEAMDWE